MFTQGTSYPLTNVSHNDLKADAAASIRYGNHKSTRNDGAVLLDILKKEVQKGWQLPLTLRCLQSIPNACIAPLGLVAQLKLDANGERSPAKRVTHNMSFQNGTVPSVNNRVIPDQLTPLVYGYALRWFLHRLVATCLLYPLNPILLSKCDIKLAYCRIHACANLALNLFVTTTGLHPDGSDTAPMALAALRLTFGGAPNPSLFSDLSKTLTDLANVFAACPDWSPKTNSDHLPRHHELVPFLLRSTPPHLWLKDGGSLSTFMWTNQEQRNVLLTTFSPWRSSITAAVIPE